MNRHANSSFTREFDSDDGSRVTSFHCPHSIFIAYTCKCNSPVTAQVVWKELETALSDRWQMHVVESLFCILNAS